MIKEGEKQIYIETAKLLRGWERRTFMARVVRVLGRGGQRIAERELGWNRGTIRKGLLELESGRPFHRSMTKRGRKPVETTLPTLMTDIRFVVDRLNETDPIFQASKHYTSISVAQVRRCLIDWCGYSNAELPTNETLRTRINRLGYVFKRY